MHGIVFLPCSDLHIKHILLRLKRARCELRKSTWGIVGLVKIDDRLPVGNWRLHIEVAASAVSFLCVSGIAEYHEVFITAFVQGIERVFLSVNLKVEGSRRFLLKCL